MVKLTANCRLFCKLSAYKLVSGGKKLSIGRLDEFAENEKQTSRIDLIYKR